MITVITTLAKKRYKCPIYTFLNEKISNKFFLKKYNPEDCKYKEK